MACQMCWPIPGHPQEKRSYYVQMSNDEGQLFECIVQTPCVHDLQEWVDEHAGDFPIKNPKVILVDAQRAAHVPVLDPTN